ncbi:MAG: hypothetical protein AAF663_02370, partial [Planctomycetota bacterium]
IKRNLGSHLRSRSTRRREQEMLLRAVVHNVMILRRLKRGLRLSRSSLLVMTNARHLLRSGKDKSHPSHG